MKKTSEEIERGKEFVFAAKKQSKVVAKYVRKLRKEQGLTLAQMSLKTGMCLSTISALETGERAIHLYQLLNMANALGYTFYITRTGKLQHKKIKQTKKKNVKTTTKNND